MKKKFLAAVSVLLLAFCFILLNSCEAKVMGYSVLLWNVPEHKLQSGDILPVYIRSNISHVYVVGIENEENANAKEPQKIEIPLWQLTEPVKKAKVSAVAKKYDDCAHSYALAKVDGLPCRAEPVNTSKQVYRLRKGESIKLLYKGKGQPPMTGGKPLEGDWYRILTSNGSPLFRMVCL